MGTFIGPGDPVVAVHATHSGAQAAVRTLRRGGFDLTKLRIVERTCRTDEHLAADRFCVIAQGSSSDVERARRILAAARSEQSLPIHQAA